jgi:hypothetical protein
MDSRPEMNKRVALFSTVRLPSPVLVRRLVAEAHRRFTSGRGDLTIRVLP